MNRNRWILACVAVLILGMLGLFYFLKPTATVVKPPAVHKHAPAKKATIAKPATTKEVPSKQMMVVVDEEAAPAPVTQPAPSQIIHHHYHYYPAIQPSAPKFKAPTPLTTPPSPIVQPAPEVPAPKVQAVGAQSSRTTVNILSGNSFSLNILSGNGSGRWNSGSHEGSLRDETPQAP